MSIIAGGVVQDLILDLYQFSPHIYKIHQPTLLHTTLVKFKNEYKT